MKSIYRLFFRSTYRLVLACMLSAIAMPAYSAANENYFENRKDVLDFINEVSKKHDFNKNDLKKLFTEIEFKQSIIDAINRPAEGKPWFEYRPIFVTDVRIKEGVKFWKTNHETLERAEKEYGVPPEVIVAIIGVETRYGKHKGGYRVLDSLATLAFGFPKRAEFFRGELEQYLLLAREEKLDLLGVMGSYAGAMGQAQFISSSYRNFAVDFDGDGKRDLWNNSSDAIGSVANYFKRHKWIPGGKITTPATVTSNHINDLVEKGYKPHSTVADLRQLGVKPESELNPEELGALIELENQTGQEYWLGLNNFYVITRYNHSPLYAMAVYQLGQAIIKNRKIESKN